MMLTSYLKTAFRHLARHKGYALLSILGLAVGLAGAGFMGRYVQWQTSFDEFHPGAERLYRVTYEVWSQDQSDHYAESVPAVGPAMEDRFAAVERSVRITRPAVEVRSGEEWIRENRFFFVDSTFFETFGFELVRGDPATVLDRPNTVVLSRAMAEKYFGTTDVVGRVLRLNFQGERELEVTGLMEVPPRNAHFRPQFVSSFSTFTDIIPYYDADNWWLRGTHTYVRLAEGASRQALAEQLPDFADEQTADVTKRHGQTVRFHLQPITAIHLGSDLRSELNPGGSRATTAAFGGLALLLLLVAGINYVNMATARVGRRRVEMGMRSMFGGGGTALGVGYLAEAVAIASLAGLIGVGLFVGTYGLIQQIAGGALGPSPVGKAEFWLVAAGFSLGAGLLAGGYPALYFSRMRPIGLLREGTEKGRSGWARFGLVALQFAATVVVLIGAFVIARQLEYMREAELGYDRDRVLVVPYEDALAERASPAAVKQQFGSVAGVEAVSLASGLPTYGTPLNGMVRPAEGPEDQNIPMTMFRVDPSFLDALGVELGAGRNFRAEQPADSSAFIVNRAAAERFGWEDPIGRQLAKPGPEEATAEQGPVIGLLEEFHFRSLHRETEPLVLELEEDSRSHLILRASTPDAEALIGDVRAAWSEVAPARPFRYTVLADRYASLYEAEEQQAAIVRAFSILSILVACLGLFGLTAYLAERRTKEIGVRKVLGATARRIWRLISVDYLKPVLVGVALAVPVAYLVADAWLSRFAFRIELGAGLFLAGTGTALLLALVTVSYHAIRAALLNPAESLRYE